MPVELPFCKHSQPLEDTPGYCKPKVNIMNGTAVSLFLACLDRIIRWWHTIKRRFKQLVIREPSIKPNNLLWSDSKMNARL